MTNKEYTMKYLEELITKLENKISKEKEKFNIPVGNKLKNLRIQRETFARRVKQLELG